VAMRAPSGLKAMSLTTPGCPARIATVVVFVAGLLARRKRTAQRESHADEQGFDDRLDPAA